jgi:FKBP-type peptidyl-prolyl cis-trans isomerase
MSKTEKFIIYLSLLLLFFISTNQSIEEHRETVQDLIEKEISDGQAIGFKNKIRILTGTNFNGLIPLFIIKRQNKLLFSRTILKIGKEEIIIGTGILNNIFLNTTGLDKRLGIEDGFVISRTGLLYKIFPTGTGQKIQHGNFIKLQYQLKYKDSIINSSYNNMPVYDEVDSLGRFHDFSEFLTQMKVGDSAVCYQFYDTLAKGNKSSIPPYMKNGEKQQITIKLLSAFKPQNGKNSRDLAIEDYKNEIITFKEKELFVIKKYLIQKNIKTELVNNSVYVEKVFDGNGLQADSGRIVGIKYNGYTLGGKYFDSNIESDKQIQRHALDTFYFISKESGAIQGMLEGITTLRMGDKAKIYITSILAYGAQGSPPIIGPYENIIFEVEVVDVRYKN